MTIPRMVASGMAVADQPPRSDGGVQNKLFNADWATAQGQSDAAIQDQGKSLHFDLTNNNQGCASVIAATGLGFPQSMANVLQIRKNNGEDFNGGPCVTTPVWSPPGIGHTIYYRLYTQVAIPDNSISIYNSNHPVQMPYNADGAWEPFNFDWIDAAHNNAGNYKLHNHTMNEGGLNGNHYTSAGNSYESDGWQNYYFAKFVTHRYEWFAKNEDGTNYSCGMRIYDATNEASGGAAVLLVSSDPVGDGLPAAQGYTSGEPGIPTLKDKGAAYQMADVNDLCSILIGSNGGHIYNQTVNWYFGGFCVALDSWIGKYRGGI